MLKYKNLFWFILWAGFWHIGLLSGRTSPLIIDHPCANLDAIPANWIDQVKNNCRMHYAHTSHGGQLISGMQTIEDNNGLFNVEVEEMQLPDANDAFCIFDGQETDSYITPDLYWETEDGLNNTRTVLQNNPTIQYSMWAWCGQLDYSDTPVEVYLDALHSLSAEFPDVTFIYMTGNAQNQWGEGHIRHQHNNEIRQYCQANNKVLFDFADMDCWWYNPVSGEWEFSTYDYYGEGVPVEHSQFHGDEAGHTTIESCVQKGRAFWWMMARLAGWEGVSNVQIRDERPITFKLNQNFPNPFNPETMIEYRLPSYCLVEITVFDVKGRLIQHLVSKEKPAGTHTVPWNGSDIRGLSVPSGVYVVRLEAGGYSTFKKMTLMR